MKRILSLIIAFMVVSNLSAQKQISLQECFDFAVIHHPVYAQKALKAENSQIEVENYKKDLLPQIILNGRATYQNEVISLPFDIPNMDVPELSKDQYKMTLDVNQVIYRGGIYQKQKNLEELQQILEQLEVDQNLYHIKNEVKNLFVTVVLLDEQNKIIDSYEKRLKAKQKEMQALIEEGAILETSADRILVELIKAKQQKDEIAIKRAALIENLETLTGQELNGVIELSLSQPQIEDQQQSRLEFQYMLETQNKLEYSKNLIDAQKLPKISAFAQGGYGRPGFNYLSDNFSEFWMVGLNFQWKILNWNKHNNQKHIMDLNIQVIESQKQDFERNIEMALNQMRAEIEKWEVVLQSDPEVIRLRTNVAENASHQMNQGVITTSAYIEELQTLSQAEIDRKIHEIQLINSKLDYLNILGKL
ncbi:MULTISPECIES: TolC family protein [unclassified Lentimicrobium]|uniref:TolC family protein n=1 Tax=unclassified Lentimicrobium TaxID=2677434 RepID=UPI001557E562|nr:MULTISPECIES: TolC family protein [unclassified Lentimicrobium]NPD46790.1 TolC family protein [Lentimicrobium sp. S6]NPD85593.1 TolC family protein [Lentimicrobium sp. L6]